MGTIHPCKSQQFLNSYKQYRIIGPAGQEYDQLYLLNHNSIAQVMKQCQKYPPYQFKGDRIINLLDVKENKYLFFQWSGRSLQTLLQQKKPKEQLLPKSTFFNIIRESVLAYSQLHSHQCQNSDNPRVQLCIKMQNIKLFKNDMQIKVVPPYFNNYQPNKLPNYIPLGSHQITILGLIFLQVGLLYNVKDVYNKPNQLKFYLQKISNIYGNFIADIIAMLIRGATWIEVQDFINNGTQVQNEVKIFTTKQIKQEMARQVYQHENWRPTSSNLLNIHQINSQYYKHQTLPVTQTLKTIIINQNQFDHNEHKKQTSQLTIYDNNTIKYQTNAKTYYPQTVTPKSKFITVDHGIHTSRLNETHQDTKSVCASPSPMREYNQNIQRNYQINITPPKYYQQKSLSATKKCPITYIRPINFSPQTNQLSPQQSSPTSRKNRQNVGKIYKKRPQSPLPKRVQTAAHPIFIRNQQNRQCCRPTIYIPLRNVSPKITRTNSFYNRNNSPISRTQRKSPSFGIQPVQRFERVPQIIQPVYKFEPSKKDFPLITNYKGIPIQTYVSKTKPDITSSLIYEQHRNYATQKEVSTNRILQSSNHKSINSKIKFPNNHSFDKNNKNQLIIKRSANKKNQPLIVDNFKSDNFSKVPSASNLPSRSKFSLDHIPQQIYNVRARQSSKKSIGSPKIHKVFSFNEVQPQNGSQTNHNPLYYSKFDYLNLQNAKEYYKTYQGQILNDKWHGKGKIFFPNGSQFQGNFVNDKIQGYGIFKKNNQSIIEGIWKNNQLIKIKNQER